MGPVLLAIAIFGIGVAFVVATWVAERLLRRAVAEGIQYFDTQVLGVDVHLGDLRINPCTGRVVARELVVDNPAGYNSKYLFRAETFVFDVSTSALLCSLGRHLVIEEFALVNVDIIYDSGLTTSNISEVLDHLEGDKDGKKKKSRQKCSSFTDAFSCLSARDKPEVARSAEGAVLLARRASSKDSPSAGLLGSELEKDDGCLRCGKTCCSARKVTIKKVKVLGAGLKLAAHVLEGLGVRIALADLNYDDFSEHEHEFQGIPALASFLLVTILRTAFSTVEDFAVATGDLATYSVDQLVGAAGSVGKTVEQEPPRRQPECC